MFTDPLTPADTRTYDYDGEGRRVIATGAAGRKVFVYDAFGRLAAEYADGSVPASSAGTFYRTVDHLGSTRAVMSAAGTVETLYDFSPFGERIGEGIGGRSAAYGVNSNFDQQFTGQERDSESGLDYFGAQSPSPDPIIPRGPLFQNLTLLLRCFLRQATSES